MEEDSLDSDMSAWGGGLHLGEEEMRGERGAKEDQSHVVEVPRYAIGVHCIPKLPRRGGVSDADRWEAGLSTG